MTAPWFIGDELTAAGFRLAGAQVWTPEPADVADVFERARAEAELLLMTAEFARHVPAARLEDAMQTGSPLVIVVPDARDAVAVPDLVRQLRRTIAVEP